MHAVHNNNKVKIIRRAITDATSAMKEVQGRRMYQNKSRAGCKDPVLENPVPGTDSTHCCVV